MTRYLLIRHAVTGIPERDQKPTDDLDRDGHQQARRLANKVSRAGVAALYTSPYQRALSTARVIEVAMGVPVQLDERLKEIPLWAAPQDLHHDNREDHLELLETLHRAQESMALLMQDLHARHPDQLVALVCHGNLIRAVLGYALEMSLETVVRLIVGHVSITELEWEDSYEEPFYRLLRLNDTAHLEG